MKKLVALLLAVALLVICSACSKEEEKTADPVATEQAATEQTAQEPVQTAAPETHISGDFEYIILEDGTVEFQPDHGIKRSEFAAIANRVLNASGLGG